MHRSRIAKRIARKTIRMIGVFIILAINAILLWRVFTAGDPASMKTLLADASTKAAYERCQAEGEDLSVLYQRFEQTTTATGRYSYFSVTRAYFLPETGQAQLVFRYSNAMLDWLAEDYGLAGTPGRDEDLFDVSLLVEYDDGEGGTYTERYFPDKTVRDTKFRYNYRQMLFSGLSCFDGEDFDESVLRVQVCIYYKEDVDFDAEPYGALQIYKKGIYTRTYDLSRRDRKAILSAA